ncbi:hypothetical protein ACFXKW_00480 [Streptomyces sp. NPDC059193]|uniref:hypothetical protein n=1 Tax=Streptomyces sp. NPDC059193 TaxID=3346763 RepID=UPI0036871F7A
MERGEDGGIRLLVARCPGTEFGGLSVYSRQGQPSRGWRVRRDGAAGLPGQIDLFTAPPGYTVTDATLQELSDSEEYAAVVRGVAHGKDAVDGRLVFTLRQVDVLGSGKVLTGIEGDKVMDRAKFLKPSSAQCE